MLTLRLPARNLLLQAQAQGGRPRLAAFGVLPVAEAVQELDLGEETVETVLSYLQVSGLPRFLQPAQRS